MKRFAVLWGALLTPCFLFASSGAASQQQSVSLFGIPLEFILFGLTLVGVAVFHNKTMYVALIGLASILILKMGVLHFDMEAHLGKEWPILLNLLGLLLGFAILARLFEDSHIPKILPKILPHDWKGPFLLILFVFFLSSFLDNIAAAIIGGSIAHVVFRGKVHIGYLAAIVAASNAGGAGSVLGDTTTTMMWIDGVNPIGVLHAYVAAVPAILLFGIIASMQQNKYHPMLKGKYETPKVDYGKLIVCLMILAGAVAANFLLGFPAAGVWAAIIIGALITTVEWEALQKAVPGSIFLLSLVFSASMMPVDKLPPASWQSAFTLGFVSSVFDNIPLTKLALEQMGYDWGILAFAVGFGGSMIWFGSSAGVALSNMFPETKSVVQWVRNGWHVTLAYIIGFFILLSVMGWRPQVLHTNADTKPAAQAAPGNP